MTQIKQSGYQQSLVRCIPQKMGFFLILRLMIKKANVKLLLKNHFMFLLQLEFKSKGASR